LVLKGGLLLAVWDVRRPTRGVDLAARRVPGDVEAVLEMMREGGRTLLDDGLVFDSHAARDGRPDPRWGSIRRCPRHPTGLSVEGVDAIHVDVNVGDPIEPAPGLVEVPRLLGGSPVTILGYPIVVVLAEKIVTMIERGEANTRWRDFADVYVLMRNSAVDRSALRVAVVSVASHRGVSLRPLAPMVPSYSSAAQQRWSAWRGRQLLDAVLPEAFGDVLASVVRFADPIVDGRTGWVVAADGDHL
jgi:hypothetical protein